MVHGKKGPNEKPLSERVYRGLLHYVESNEGTNKALLEALNSQEQISITTSTLRFLVLSQKLFLYCPSLLDSQSSNLKSDNVFKKVFLNWKHILDNEVRNPDDQFRCKYFIRLITHLSSYLSNKIKITQEFSGFIDSAFNLKGIIDGSEFKNKQEP